jgi:hypothetical protein
METLEQRIARVVREDVEVVPYDAAWVGLFRQDASIVPGKSRRDGRKRGVTVQASLRDEIGIRYTRLRSDKSLGYCQTTLRVEIRALPRYPAQFPRCRDRKMSCRQAASVGMLPRHFPCPRQALRITHS